MATLTVLLCHGWTSRITSGRVLSTHLSWRREITDSNSDWGELLHTWPQRDWFTRFHRLLFMTQKRLIQIYFTGYYWLEHEENHQIRGSIEKYVMRVNKMTISHSAPFCFLKIEVDVIHHNFIFQKKKFRRLKWAQRKMQETKCQSWFIPKTNQIDLPPLTSSDLGVDLDLNINKLQHFYEFFWKQKKTIVSSHKSPLVILES